MNPPVSSWTSFTHSSCELNESGPQPRASSSPTMGPPTSPNMQPTMGVIPNVTVSPNSKFHPTKADPVLSAS